MFTGSYVDGYPFPALIDIGLRHLTIDEKQNLIFKNLEADEDDDMRPSIMTTESKFDMNGTMNNSNKGQNNNDFIFFDFIKKFRDNFVRLTEIKIYYEYKPINTNKHEKIDYKGNFHNKTTRKQPQE